jgi:hypothetical protein
MCIQSLLAGESVARYRVWDGMRGIDVLQSRPVDRERIGVRLSGGDAHRIAALDERAKAAARLLHESREEQLKGSAPGRRAAVPRQLAVGLNHADFAIAFAPKPYLI